MSSPRFERRTVAPVAVVSKRVIVRSSFHSIDTARIVALTRSDSTASAKNSALSSTPDEIRAKGRSSSATARRGLRRAAKRPAETVTVVADAAEWSSIDGCSGWRWQKVP